MSRFLSFIVGAVVAVAAVVLLGYLLYTTLMPARVLEIRDSVWHVTSVDGGSLTGLSATLVFDDTELALESLCGSRTLGYDLDSDDVGIDFWLLSSEPAGCANSLMEQEQQLVDALLSVESWRIRGDDAIALDGAVTIDLLR